MYKRFKNLRIKAIGKKIQLEKELSKEDIVFLFSYVTSFDNEDVKNILVLINRYHLGTKLYNDYLHYKTLIDLSIEIEELEKELSNKLTEELKKELEKQKKLLKDLDFSINRDKYDLHKFIRLYHDIDIIDKIYNTNNDIFYNKCKSLKDLQSKKNRLIGVKIDYDLLKSNEHKLKDVPYLKIVVYHYDVTKIYYLLDVEDLEVLDIKYSYDFNNLLSYLLDYKFTKFYDVFNDKKLVNRGFRFMKTFNRVLINKTKDKTDLRVNRSYKYSNDYITFNNILDLDLNDLDLKYLDLDLIKELKQLDLELLSIDNDKDYLNLINNFYDVLNNYLYDLEDVYNDLKEDVNSRKEDNNKKTSFSFKTYNYYDNKDLAIFRDVFRFSKRCNKYLKNYRFFYNLNSLDEVIKSKLIANLDLKFNIDVRFIDNDLLNDIDKLNDLSNDKKVLNNLLDMLEHIIKRYNVKISNENFKKNILKIEKMNKHNTKSKCNDLEQIKNNNKNYCYDLSTSNKNYCYDLDFNDFIRSNQNYNNFRVI
ncbi:MAG: hypothetical protein IJ997_00765 [Mycoplasmataceae bacterium]|nr:hypothetical protein [Mycoplasmataceae bacterium]